MTKIDLRGSWLLLVLVFSCTEDISPIPLTLRYGKSVNPGTPIHLGTDTLTAMELFAHIDWAFHVNAPNDTVTLNYFSAVSSRILNDLIVFQNPGKKTFSIPVAPLIPHPNTFSLENRTWVMSDNIAPYYLASDLTEDTIRVSNSDFPQMRLNVPDALHSTEFTKGSLTVNIRNKFSAQIDAILVLMTGADVHYRTNLKLNPGETKAFNVSLNNGQKGRITLSDQSLWKFEAIEFVSGIIDNQSLELSQSFSEDWAGNITLARDTTLTQELDADGFPLTLHRVDEQINEENIDVFHFRLREGQIRYEVKSSPISAVEGGNEVNFQLIFPEVYKPDGTILSRFINPDQNFRQEIPLRDHEFWKPENRERKEEIPWLYTLTFERQTPFFFDSQEGEISVDVELYNFDHPLDQFVGYLDFQSFPLMADAVDIPLFVSSLLHAKDIRLPLLSLNYSITNDYGIPVSVRLDSLFLLKPGHAPQSMPWVGEGTMTILDDSVFTGRLGRGQLQELVDYRPTEIRYFVTPLINLDSNNPDPANDFEYNDKLAIDLDVEIPFHIGLDSLPFSFSFPIDTGYRHWLHELEGGTIHVLLKGDLQVASKLTQLYFYNDDGERIDSLYEDEVTLYEYSGDCEGSCFQIEVNKQKAQNILGSRMVTAECMLFSDGDGEDNLSTIKEGQDFRIELHYYDGK